MVLVQNTFMTNLLNKSNHPVEVKKVKVRIWTLRSEIEAAVAKKMETSKEQAVNIDDIKEFYQTHIPTHIEEEIVSEESSSDNSEIAQKTEEALSEEKNESGENQKSDGESEDKPFERIIPNEDLIYHGEVLLSDVHMERIMLFTNQKFIQGQNIIIQFLITSPFIISGEVKKVIHYARNSKIIKETRLDHRIQFDCSLLFPHERSNLREFLMSIEPTIPTAPKKLKQQEDSDDDDFDDLGL